MNLFCILLTYLHKFLTLEEKITHSLQAKRKKYAFFVSKAKKKYAFFVSKAKKKLRITHYALRIILYLCPTMFVTTFQNNMLRQMKSLQRFKTNYLVMPNNLLTHTHTHTHSVI